MGKISEIVKVTITKEGASITQAGFSTSLILVESTALSSRVGTFQESSDLLTNSIFGANSSAYKAALAHLGQDVKPDQYKVGCKGNTDRNCKQRLIFDAAATAGTFKLSYKGEFTDDIAFDATTSAIETAIEAISFITSVTVTEIVASKEWTIEFDGADANKMFDLIVPDVTDLTTTASGSTEFAHNMAWGSALGVETVAITVTVNGVSKTTAAIDVATWSAPVIKTAIEALSNVGSNNTVVEEIVADQSYDIKFVNDLYGTTNAVTALASIEGAATMTEWYQGQANESWVDAYNACKDVDDDFYTLITPDLFSSAHKTDQIALAAVIQAEENRLYSAKSSDSTIISVDYNETTPADLPSSLAALSYDKSFCTYQNITKSETEYPEAAIVGRQSTRVPGSSTYKFKTLSGVTAESLTATQKQYLFNKNCNVNETFGGLKIYREGTTGTGEFIDLVTGIDFLSTRLSEYIFTKIASVEKASYDSAGIATVESLLRTALKIYGVDNNLITSDSIIITVPEYNNIPEADKNARVLKQVKFRVQFIGAIHSVEVEGTVYL